MTETETPFASATIARAAANVLPAGFGVRACDSGDIEALGALYLAAYPPGVACATLEEAVANIHATFSGEQG
jgi:hypothetical protein